MATKHIHIHVGVKDGANEDRANLNAIHGNILQLITRLDMLAKSVDKDVAQHASELSKHLSKAV